MQDKTLKTDLECMITVLKILLINVGMVCICYPQSSCDQLIFVPHTRDELIAMVQAAIFNKQPIIPICSNGSYEGCTAGKYANQYYIDMRQLNRILWIDIEKQQVCVEAGILLDDLIRPLAQVGLQLVDHVANEGLSVGGTLATGSHGASLAGYLPDSIVALELIDGTGTTHWLSKTENPDYLRAAVVSFGCLGIIYTVIIQCQPLEYVKQEIEYISIASFCSNIDTYLDQYINLRGEMNPYTGFMRLQKVSRCTNTLPNHNLYYATHKMAYGIQDGGLFEIVRYLGPMHGWDTAVTYAIDTMILMRNNTIITDYYPRITTPFDYRIARTHPLTLYRLNEEEFAVPLHRFPAAIHAVMNTFKTLAAQGIYNIRHVTIRLNKGKGFSYLGEVGKGIFVWINIVLLHTRLVTVIDNQLQLVAAVSAEQYCSLTDSILKPLEDLLVIQHNARPHWGKNNYLTPEKVRILYGNMYDAFIAIRHVLDPHGLFLNPYTSCLFT
jgi:hypothetical protein